MKKIQAKRLGFQAETIRALDDASLLQVAGGSTACLIIVPPNTTVSLINSGCKLPTTIQYGGGSLAC